MDSGPPPLRLLLGEAGFVFEWIAGYRRYRRLSGPSLRQGQVILVIPGLLAADWMTRPLRRVLAARGHDVHGWGLGTNLGLRPGLLEKIEQLVAALARQRGRAITLVGWSLGGLYAREIAKRRPELIDRVLTLGSPFSGSPRANNAWRIYERIAGHSVDHPPIRGSLAEKPPVPTIALWSRRDGIISPASARGLPGEADRTIEVDCTHLGFVGAASSIEAILHAIED